MTRLALRLALPVLLLGAVWWLADGQAALRRLAGAEPGWLVLAFAALHAQTVLSALRWRLTAAALGQPMPAGLALREYYLAQAVNQTLPGGVAGDAARAVRARGQAGLMPAVAAVVIERLAGQAALLLALAAGLAAGAAVGGWPAPFLATAALLPAAGAAALLALWAARGTVRAGRFWQALRQGLLAPGLWPPQAALSVAIVALNLASFALAARATGTPLAPDAALVLVPLVLMAMLLPLSVAGWGWREGAAAALFPLAGATPEAGVAASAAFGALVLAAALPGLFVLPRKALSA